LRLVQENPESGGRKVSDDETRNKRASWMGWASSAFGKKEESIIDGSIQE
jgi:hypothetical protein